MCTDHFSVPVCVSCTFTVAYSTWTYTLTHTLTYKSKQPPCYFCLFFFRINLMDWMSGDITTDWLKQDTKCTIEGNTTHCITRDTHTCPHAHPQRFSKPVTVTALLHAGTHAQKRQTLLCIATTWKAHAHVLFHGIWRVTLGIGRGITGLMLSQGCGLLPLKFPPPQMKVAVEVWEGTQVFQLLNSPKLFDLLSCICNSQVADSPVYEPSRCISPLKCAALWPVKLVLFPTN